MAKYLPRTIREMEWMDRAEAAEAEVARLRLALDRLAHPNRGVNATGEDARRMAEFALDVLDGSPSPV